MAAQQINPLHTARKSLLTLNSQSYGQWLIDAHGAVAVWQLTDMYDATILALPDGAGLDGVATGFDIEVNTIPGPDGKGNAPYLEGANDYGDPYTAALASLFDSDEGAVSIWCQMGPGVWTDGAIRNILELRNDAAPDDNRLAVYKFNVNNQIAALFRGAGTNSINAVISSTAYPGWFQVFMRWSASENSVGVGINGVLLTSGAHNDWSEGLAEGYCGFGARLTAGSPSLVHSGWLAWAAFWAGNTLSAPLPTVADFLAMHNKAVG